MFEFKIFLEVVGILLTRKAEYHGLAVGFSLF